MHLQSTQYDVICQYSSDSLEHMIHMMLVDPTPFHHLKTCYASSSWSSSAGNVRDVLYRIPRSSPWKIINISTSTNPPRAMEIHGKGFRRKFVWRSEDYVIQLFSYSFNALVDRKKKQHTHEMSTHTGGCLSSHYNSLVMSRGCQQSHSPRTVAGQFRRKSNAMGGGLQVEAGISHSGHGVGTAWLQAFQVQHHQLDQRNELKWTEKDELLGGLEHVSIHWEL